jgi:hypothetical protein
MKKVSFTFEVAAKRFCDINSRKRTFLCSKLYLSRLMLHYFRLNRSSLLLRTIYIASAVFVFSYILFDVLDLDLSDFPLRQAPLERSAVVTQVPKGTEHTFLPDRTVFWVDLSLLFSEISKESLRLQHKGMLRSLLFDSARTRVYRIALPRSSTKDSSPSA